MTSQDDEFGCRVTSFKQNFSWLVGLLLESGQSLLFFKLRKILKVNKSQFHINFSKSFPYMKCHISLTSELSMGEPINCANIDKNKKLAKMLI